MGRKASSEYSDALLDDQQEFARISARDAKQLEEAQCLSVVILMAVKAVVARNGDPRHVTLASVHFDLDRTLVKDVLTGNPNERNGRLGVPPLIPGFSP